MATSDAMVHLIGEDDYVDEGVETCIMSDTVSQ